MEFKNIKSREELKQVLKSLEDQGFGYFYDYENHNKKVDKVIDKYNTLDVNYDSGLKNELSKIDNYEEMEKKAEEYFSKFKPDDKINELLNIYYLSSDARGKIPSYNYPDINEIVAWTNFKNKWNLTDEFKGYYVEIYNLDKNYLKIHFYDNSWDFKKLYKLIFNEECLDFGKNRYGEWQDIGKIEIKFFQNGYANIKGDLSKFKEYYYKQNSKQKNSNNIIIYNKKREIIKGRDN